MSGVEVYLGHWTNWSRGKVLGSTITLSSRNGGLLTAFLAIFVAVAGTSFWRIASFVAHQRRSSRDPQDGLHQQQQVILRNSGAPSDALWNFMQLGWYWRKSAERTSKRSASLTIMALLTMLFWLLAGIFSSDITKAAGNEVLLQPRTCGMWNSSRVDFGVVIDGSTYKSLNDTMTAAGYARSCYENSRNKLECDQYVQPKIAWKVDENAPCPFSENICIRSEQRAAYKMDTGHINSHNGLGINSPELHRLDYRRVTTCSPITTKGYTTEVNITDPDSLNYGDTTEHVLYGAVAGFGNYTLAYDERISHLDQPYSLYSQVYFNGAKVQGWTPTPALYRDDADVTLFLLAANSVTYGAPVADPFFRANLKESAQLLPGSPNSTWWNPDLYITALACADQHQFCAKGKCTALGSYMQVFNASVELDLNEPQAAIRNRLSNLIMYTLMYFSVDGRGSSALRASETLYQGTQTEKIPDNQWTIEVSSWMAVSMAKLQQLAVQYVTGPPTESDKASVVKPTTRYERAMCHSQKVRVSSGVTSFSVLGMSIILVVGSLIILTSLFLSSLVSTIRRKHGREDYRSLQWAMDDNLQLHRLAYEEAGQGHWRGGVDSVPVTKRGELIGVPDGVDQSHPRLSKLSAVEQVDTYTYIPEELSLLGKTAIPSVRGL